MCVFAFAFENARLFKCMCTFVLCWMHVCEVRIFLAGTAGYLLGGVVWVTPKWGALWQETVKDFKWATDRPVLRRLNIILEVVIMWQLSGSVQACPTVCDYFVAIFEVAQNRLKFGMSTLFVLENVPVVFFSRMQKNMDKIVSTTPHPPPPSLSISEQCRISILESQNTVRVSFYAIGGGRDARRGGGGGGLSRACLKPKLFPHLWKKFAGTVFHRKGVSMPNFSGFWATWKIATK